MAGSSLRDFCVARLTGQGEPEVPTQITAEAEVIKLAEKVSGAVAVLPQFRREGNMIYERKVEQHDPATCRTYKCGMCAAMKGEKQ